MLQEKTRKDTLAYLFSSSVANYNAISTSKQCVKVIKIREALALLVNNRPAFLMLQEKTL
jgi:hypothetical protein